MVKWQHIKVETDWRYGPPQYIALLRSAFDAQRVNVRTSALVVTFSIVNRT